MNPMNLADTPQEAAFREEARTWLEEHLPEDWRGWMVREASLDRIEERQEWERRLAEGNWIGIYWPEEYGGRGKDLATQIIFVEEYARVGAPPRLSFFGEGLLGPTLLVFGTEEQKRRFLPGITEAREYWCQGYSEPNAGSDLAGIRTTAVLEDGEWVINGQKIWTTMGHRAHHMFLLARTEPEERHRGLSYLLMPMDQPGVELRPIRQMTGSAEFNEVFLNDARAPGDGVVGGRGQGWSVGLTTLAFERSTAALTQTIRFRQEFERLRGRLEQAGILEDPVVRQRLVDLHIRLRVMRFNNYRLITELVSRGGAPGPQSSLSKVIWSEWHRDFTEAAVDLLGPWGMLGDEVWQDLFLESRGETIYAGTSEVQRNIIGELVLGLPKGPKLQREPAPRRKTA